jgi:hypothetical protein
LNINSDERSLRISVLSKDSSLSGFDVFILQSFHLNRVSIFFMKHSLFRRRRSDKVLWGFEYQWRRLISRLSHDFA